MKSLLEYVNRKKFADIIILCNDEILLLRRANYIKQFPGKWCLPGGTVNNDESTRQTIIRELKEETSIEISEPNFWETYTYQTHDTTDIYYIELQEKPEVKISKEHAQYKWVKTDEIVKYAEKFASETYTIIKEFLGTYYNTINEG